VAAKEDLATKVIAIGTVIIAGLTYLGVAAARNWFPFEPGPSSLAAPGSTTSTSPGPTSTATRKPPPVARTVGYLDASAPASGGPVGRGVATINGQSFAQSVWLSFAESCCGSAQSVTYSVPAGYRQFTGELGEEEAAGLPSGYTMLFSISINGLQVIDNRQVLLGDPPVPFKVSMPAAVARIVIDVTANCPNVYCVGNAVVGNARVIPARAHSG
jgi:hypothetical protein